MDAQAVFWLSVIYGLMNRLSYVKIVSMHFVNQVIACFKNPLVGDLVIAAEEAVNDIALWTPRSDVIILAMGQSNFAGFRPRTDCQQYSELHSSLRRLYHSEIREQHL